MFDAIFNSRGRRDTWMDMPELSGDRFEAHAVFVAERLDLRTVAPRIANHPMVVEVGERGWAALFRYGAVVFFAVPPMSRERFLDDLRPRLTRPYDEPEHESIVIRIDAAAAEGMDDRDLVLHDAGVDRLQVVAEILAKSVVMAQYEEQVADAFHTIEPLAVDLKERGVVRRTDQLLGHIGDTMLIRHRMVGRVEVPEKPELLWERADLERLYARLEDEYELVERHVALERKLDLITSTASTSLEILQTKRSLRVEWYIVILIVAEILLTLWDMFVRHG